MSPEDAPVNSNINRDGTTRDAIALAVSEADACNYCLAAHSYIATNLAKISPEEIALNREGRSTDPKRQAAVAFAKALIEKHGKVSDDEFRAVKGAGWTLLRAGQSGSGQEEGVPLGACPDSCWLELVDEG